MEPDSSLNESFAILNSSESIAVQPDKQVYRRGEKISISFELKKPKVDGVPDVSVSVSEFHPGVPFEQSISNYFSSRTEIIPANLSGKRPYAYMPEYKGSVLQGRVKGNSQPESNSAS